MSSYRGAGQLASGRTISSTRHSHQRPPILAHRRANPSSMTDIVTANAFFNVVMKARDLMVGRRSETYFVPPYVVPSFKKALALSKRTH